ncbi:MAG: hypothetical protein JZU53_04880 [Paludibacter sp.]|nr:hypothetical protein [Paludibacter sp.]
MDKKIEQILNNNFVAFFQEGLTFKNVDELEKVINRIIQNEEVSDIDIHQAMLDYARIYELFRPDRIRNEDYYWGTSNLNDIFSILYRHLGVHQSIVFSKFGYSSPFKYTGRQRINCNDFYRLSDIKRISQCIKKTIGQKATELYTILDDSISDYHTQLYIKKYVKLLLNSESVNIKFPNNSSRTIKVNEQIILIESERTFRDEILKINSLFLPCI